MEFLIILLLFIQSIYSFHEYHGAQVWRTHLKNTDDVHLFKQFLVNENFHNLSTQIWFLNKRKVEYLVMPAEIDKMQDLLIARKLTYTVYVRNVMQEIDKQKVTKQLSGPSLRSERELEFDSFPTLAVIEEYLEVVQNNYPKLCHVSDIGLTVENRKLKMLKISNGSSKNKNVFLLAGVHGREWAAITSVLYIADRLINHFDLVIPTMRDINWYIIPVANPDGYEHTHSTNRLWRKNRKRIHKCHGVDLNRNFGSDWRKITEDNCKPCTESYDGEGPFSEPESRAIRDAVQGINETISALVDFHSYGRLILYPWAAREKPTKDAKYNKRVAERIHEALKDEFNVDYEFGDVYHTIYPASGSLIDWAYSTGVKISLAIEIGDPDNGFILPPENIIDTGKKMWAAVKHLTLNLK